MRHLFAVSERPGAAVQGFNVKRPDDPFVGIVVCRHPSDDVHPEMVITRFAERRGNHRSACLAVTRGWSDQECRCR